MKALGLLTALCLSALLPFSSRAAGLEPTKALRCALVGIAECDTSASCSEVALDQVELPDVLRVDFAAKQLSSPESERTSPIHSVELFEEAIVVQGSQNGRGWTMVIERQTGQLSATIASAEGSFVISGGCTGE